MYGGGRGVVNMFVRRYRVWRRVWCSEQDVCEEVQCMEEAWCSEHVCEEVQGMEEGVV